MALMVLILQIVLYMPSLSSKRDIEELPPNESITRIMATKPVSYKWIDTKNLLVVLLHMNLLKPDLKMWFMVKRCSR